MKNLLFNMFNCFLLTLFCTCCAPNHCSFYCSLVANIALKHVALGSTNFSAKGNPLANAATDGKYLLGGPPCFYSKYKGKASWVTDLGPNNRVAMVRLCCSIVASPAAAFANPYEMEGVLVGYLGKMVT